MIVVALCVQVAGAAAQTKVEKQLSIRHHLSQAEIKISNSFFFNKYLKITSKTTVRIITIQSTIQYMELFFLFFCGKRCYFITRFAKWHCFKTHFFAAVWFLKWNITGGDCHHDERKHHQGNNLSLHLLGNQKRFTII